MPIVNFLLSEYNLFIYLKMISHYDVLGVAPEATLKEVKRKYHVMALRLHPDKSEGSHSQFGRLQEAWTVLADPHQRAEYDRQLKRDMVMIFLLILLFVPTLFSVWQIRYFSSTLN